MRTYITEQMEGRQLTIRTPVFFPPMHHEHGVYDASQGVKDMQMYSFKKTHPTPAGTKTGGFEGSVLGIVVSREATLDNSIRSTKFYQQIAETHRTLNGLPGKQNCQD